MAQINSLNMQMQEFKSSANSIEQRFDTIYFTAQEMISELEEGFD
jgi:hypothetical protein